MVRIIEDRYLDKIEGIDYCVYRREFRLLGILVYVIDRLDDVGLFGVFSDRSEDIKNLYMN